MVAKDASQPDLKLVATDLRSEFQIWVCCAPVRKVTKGNRELNSIFISKTLGDYVVVPNTEILEVTSLII